MLITNSSPSPNRQSQSSALAKTQTGQPLATLDSHDFSSLATRKLPHFGTEFNWRFWDPEFYGIRQSVWKEKFLVNGSNEIKFHTLNFAALKGDAKYAKQFIENVDMPQLRNIAASIPVALWQPFQDFLVNHSKFKDSHKTFTNHWFGQINEFDRHSDGDVESSKQWGWLTGGFALMSALGGGIALRHNLQEEAKRAAHEQLLEARKAQFRQQLKLGAGVTTGISALALLMGALASRRALQKSELDIKKSALDYAQRFEGGFEVFDHKNIPAHATLNTLIGHEAVKEKLYNLLKKMAYPQLSQQFYPEGHVLKCALVGPPGTGKTQAIRALTNEINRLQGSGNAVMIKVNGALLSGKDGAGMLRQLRNKLNEMSEGSTAIIFMDEADSIPKKGKGSVDDDRVVNQLQELMDGVNGIKSGVNVAWFFASNMLEKLEPALISRIGQEILKLDPPGQTELKTMLQSFFQKAYLQPGFPMDFDAYAATCHKLGLVGRDVNDVSELLKSGAVAKLDPRKRPPNKLIFTQDDLDKALKTVSSKIKVMVKSQEQA